MHWDVGCCGLYPHLSWRGIETAKCCPEEARVWWDSLVRADLIFSMFSLISHTDKHGHRHRHRCARETRTCAHTHTHGWIKMSKARSLCCLFDNNSTCCINQCVFPFLCTHHFAYTCSDLHKRNTISHLWLAREWFHFCSPWKFKFSGWQQSISSPCSRVMAQLRELRRCSPQSEFNLCSSYRWGAFVQNQWGPALLLWHCWPLRPCCAAKARIVCCQWLGCR